MNTKFTLGIVAVLALLFTGSLVATSNNPTEIAEEAEAIAEEIKETEPITQSSSIEVTYTDNGFEPKEITISKGQTVTWTNNSNQGMWVASSLHPAHNIYPEKSDNDCLGSSFDACEAKQPGESYSFTFNTKGGWGYHDHLYAGKVGVVIVE